MAIAACHKKYRKDALLNHLTCLHILHDQFTK